jgi:phenylpropionate dioxygenase-like ring-hydroxylating dioxygenase large terminal subunit
MTTVWRGWFAPGGERSDVLERLIRQDLETTVAEDIRLVESVQQGLGCRGYRPGPLVIDPDQGLNSEHSIAALYRWYREAMAD